MRALLAALLVIVGAGCSAAESASNAEPKRRVVVAASPTTLPPVTVPPPAPRPTDELGQRCQVMVDSVVVRLGDKAPPNVDAVCRTREQDVWLQRGGYSVGMLVVVRYPLDIPEWNWERAWNDIAAHEIGHAWSRRLTPEQQQFYAAIRGQAGWNGEDFADVYAAVVAGVNVDGRGGLSYIGSPPPAEQIEALCAAGLLPC